MGKAREVSSWGLDRVLAQADLVRGRFSKATAQPSSPSQGLTTHPATAVGKEKPLPGGGLPASSQGPGGRQCRLPHGGLGLLFLRGGALRLGLRAMLRHRPFQETGRERGCFSSLTPVAEHREGLRSICSKTCLRVSSPVQFLGVASSQGCLS